MTTDDIYDVSEVEFFNHHTTQRVIIELAKVKSMVIFCGAGVTIDYTSQGWCDMVRDILGDQSIVPSGEIGQAHVDSLFELLEPAEVGSIAMSYAMQNCGGDRDKAVLRLINRLRQTLYPPTTWDSGKLADNVAALVVARHKLPGMRTTVLTTNFDDILHEKIGCDIKEDTKYKILELHGPYIAREGDRGNYNDLIKAWKGLKTSIIHLHGRIPRAESPQDPRLVFDEVDYGQRSHISNLVIQKVMNSAGGSLILGSSLKDPPLMSALSALEAKRGCKRKSVTGHQVLNTREKSRLHDGIDTFAVTALSSYGSSSKNLTTTDASSLRKHFDARLRSFGVKLLMPDCYGQVAQLALEIERATGKEHYERYAERLETWWRKQASTFMSPMSPEDRAKLVAAMNSLVKQLDVPQKPRRMSREEFKLEIWVRNVQGKFSRSLQLWGSSVGSMTFDPVQHYGEDFTAGPRTALLSLASSYSAVEAFQLGKPVLRNDTKFSYDMASRRDPSSARWGTYLSVPYLTPDQSEFPSLPVGVLVLASTFGEDETILCSRKPASLSLAVDTLTHVGNYFLSGDDGVKSAVFLK